MGSERCKRKWLGRYEDGSECGWERERICLESGIEGEGMRMDDVREQVRGERSAWGRGWEPRLAVDGNLAAPHPHSGRS